MKVEKLGLATMVDLIVSSGGAGLTKTGGLFGFVLGEMRVRAEDFPYIGDSLDQDITPALAVGVPAAWPRSEHVSADDKAPDGEPTVSRLADALPHPIAG
jgi:FMN phosphatase YigB (HAD superfamily)